MLVERVLLGARGVVGDDGECALVGAGLWRITSLAGREDEAQAATRAPDVLILSPIFAPLACW